MIGQPLHEVLTIDQQRALHAAAEILTSTLLDDIKGMKPRGRLEFGVGDSLPPKYQRRYDERFARNLLVCLVTVTWKLWDQEAHRLACTGEELALKAIIDFAEDELSGQGKPSDLGDLEEAAFEDYDHRL